jgi:hypothetical protein
MMSSSGGRRSPGHARVRGKKAVDANARLLAVEVLLTDPEQLGNDALEGDLYILRDQLVQENGNRVPSSH